jgi:hypothetical protein
VFDEMNVLQPNTCDALMFNSKMCHFLTGLGNFGGFYFCPAANKSLFLHG